jgi:hypothetical protein
MAGDANHGWDLAANRMQGSLIVTDWLVSSLVPFLAPGSPRV